MIKGFQNHVYEKQLIWALEEKERLLGKKSLALDYILSATYYYDAAKNSRLWPFLSIWPWKGNGFYEMEKKKTKTNLPLNGVKVKVIEPRTKRLFSNRNKGQYEEACKAFFVNKGFIHLPGKCAIFKTSFPHREKISKHLRKKVHFRRFSINVPILLFFPFMRTNKALFLLVIVWETFLFCISLS